MEISLGRFFTLIAFLIIVSATPRQGFAEPAKTDEPRVIMDVSKAKFLVYSPPPQYPSEARKNHWGGFGIFEVQLRHGVASAVFVTLSTGHKVLDNAATTALRQWRSWKDHPRAVMVPITFAPGGANKKARDKG